MLGRKHIQVIRLTLSISQGSVSFSLGGDPPELAIGSGAISVLEDNSAVPHDHDGRRFAIQVASMANSMSTINLKLSNPKVHQQRADRTPLKDLQWLEGSQ